MTAAAAATAGGGSSSSGKKRQQTTSSGKLHQAGMRQDQAATRSSSLLHVLQALQRVPPLVLPG